MGPTATTIQANELILSVIGTEDTNNTSTADAGLGTWQNGFTAGPTVKTPSGALYYVAGINGI